MTESIGGLNYQKLLDDLENANLDEINAKLKSPLIMKLERLRERLTSATEAVALSDFQPINQWKYSAQNWSGTDMPQYVIDQSGQNYLNDSKSIIRFKSFLLAALGVPVLHSIATVLSTAYRIVKVVSLADFWMNKKGETSYSFTGRLLDAGENLLKIITAPLSFVCLQLAAFYGMVSPYDGRKLYATIERAQYGSFTIAPCFQPNPTHHAFGGDIQKPNQF